MRNFIEGFGYVQKKYTRGLVLGKATVNQLRYSEQLMNCRALGSKTALLRNNKIKSSAVLIQTLQKHELVYFAQTRKALIPVNPHERPSSSRTSWAPRTRVCNLWPRGVLHTLLAGREVAHLGETPLTSPALVHFVSRSKGLTSMRVPNNSVKSYIFGASTRSRFEDRTMAWWSLCPILHLRDFEHLEAFRFNFGFDFLRLRVGGGHELRLLRVRSCFNMKLFKLDPGRFQPFAKGPVVDIVGHSDL
ncbi:hypothetical protein TNCV_4933741 [Trichonephila clavipes]|nr:hypothetical protein TNCV_4933741 [Trichonephila clavipes]